MPKPRHQQDEEQSCRIGPRQLTVKHRELADRKKRRRKQTNLAVEPLSSYQINEIHGADAHQRKGQLDPELAPAENPNPKPQESFHPNGMTVGHDALLDEVVEIVEAGTQQSAELVMHKRHLTQFPQTQYCRHNNDDTY